MKPETKVFQTYFDCKKNSLYFNEIKESSKLSDSSLANTLNKLVNNKILTKTKTKSNTFYKIQDKKVFELEFSKLALDKFQSLNRGVRVPLNNFLTGFPKEVFTIILFGSASRNKETKDSDIDILIVSQVPLKIDKNKNNAEILSKYPLNLFECSVEEFLENKDDIIIQARNTGFPIYKEQNFYEVTLNEY